MEKSLLFLIKTVIIIIYYKEDRNNSLNLTNNAFCAIIPSCKGGFFKKLLFIFDIRKNLSERREKYEI